MHYHHVSVGISMHRAASFVSAMTLISAMVLAEDRRV